MSSVATKTKRKWVWDAQAFTFKRVSYTYEIHPLPPPELELTAYFAQHPPQPVSVVSNNTVAATNSGSVSDESDHELVYERSASSKRKVGQNNLLVGRLPVQALKVLLQAAGIVVSGDDVAGAGSVADMLVTQPGSNPTVRKMLQIKYLSTKEAPRRPGLDGEQYRLCTRLHHLKGVPDDVLVVLGNPEEDIWYVFMKSDMIANYSFEYYRQFRCQGQQVAARIVAKLPHAAAYDAASPGINSTALLMSWVTTQALRDLINAAPGSDVMVLFDPDQQVDEMPYDATFNGATAELKSSTKHERGRYFFNLHRMYRQDGRRVTRPYSTKDGIKHWFFVCLPADAVYRDTARKQVKTLEEAKPRLDRYYHFTEQQMIANGWLSTVGADDQLAQGGVVSIRLPDPYFSNSASSNQYFSNLHM